jgi:NTE family protein
VKATYLIASLAPVFGGAGREVFLMRALRKSHKLQERPPFECIALLLQGGGALGAYQAGVYEALAEAGLHPDWVAGISIGSINSALIAGNAPAERVNKLRQFWETVSADPHWNWNCDMLRNNGDIGQSWANQLSSMSVAWGGVDGMFRPRTPGPWLYPSGSPQATSYYNNADLGITLERLIDFDRVNKGDVRLSVGAVNIRTGNFVYFDTTTHSIGPEHVMASSALPPAFPSVEIEGEHYWDGGVVSNTPLQWVLEYGAPQDTLVFQVDLWSARGEVPRNMGDVMTRYKEIQYSSRTRANTDRFKSLQALRNALSVMLQKLPDEMRSSPEFSILNSHADRKVYNLVQLIYRSRQYEDCSKDFEFSRRGMEEHWRAGYHDTVRTLRHPEVFERPSNHEGVFSFDLARDGRE